MANAIFGYTNRVLTSSISTGSEVVGLSGGNLQSPHGSAAEGWQTAGGVATSEAGAWVLIDAGVSVSWRAFMVARTNLTTSAEIQWRVDATSDFPSPVLDTGRISAGITAEIGQSLYVHTSTVYGRYCRLDLWDAGNPDVCVNVALAYAGPIWQLATGNNIGRGTSYDPERALTQATARGGQDHTQYQWRKRAWSIDLQWIDDDDFRAQMLGLDRASMRGINVLFVPDPDSAYAAQDAVFGLLKSTSPMGYVTETGASRFWAARISERL